LRAVRLLAIDIDGTLLDSRGAIPADNLAALQEATRRGIHLALVTGRSFHFTLPIAAKLASTSPTMVVNNGALIKTPDGATEMRRPLPRSVAASVLDATPDFEESVALVFDRPGDAQIVFDRMDWKHPNRQGYYEKNRPFIAPATPLAGALTEDPIQVMFNGELGPMRALVASLRALPESDAFHVAITEYPHRDFALVDVNAAGCSKGSTLAAWVHTRGWRPDEVLAAGDNLNDLEMLTFAGTRVVMGNASELLKSKVPDAYITGTHDDAGLAKALRTLVLKT